MVPPELARWTVCIVNFNLITMAIRLCLRTRRISSLSPCISAIISSAASTISWVLIRCRCLGIRYASICFWIALNIATIFWTVGFYSGISSSRFCLGSFSSSFLVKTSTCFWNLEISSWIGFIFSSRATWSLAELMFLMMSIIFCKEVMAVSSVCLSWNWLSESLYLISKLFHYNDLWLYRQ